ncbi:HAD family hydrolase [Fimbriimonas ginsengisoli]|uniref:Haloacid dehalogenase superfamily enzyme, subfamily IA n=1 Tax=Fimbriimonas ginsengisoli Gsoil 348 TaxID=661478 RepID=A0A068NRR3_FIMGI|nr:HAD-IA family hydrolase [Fimbriimonas ginsengisoli]AIE86106.1 haloacid dehalogenase superfamily enzyme, subfamily IA [Fimbriimonas ginsengisoli Gsoil 348]
MPLRALFFDFDGLIVDTETPEVEVWREVFAEHGTEFPEQYWIDCIGRGSDQIEEKPIALLARLAPRSAEWVAVDADRHHRVMARIHAQPLRPGVAELAEEARLAGLVLAVVSSSSHAWVDPLLRRQGILDRFGHRVCRDDAARAKPFPDLYLLACERCGVQPSEAIALEDSPNGIRAAKAAGVFVVAVPNPITGQLDLSHADARLDTLGGVTLSDVAILASRARR